MLQVCERCVNSWWHR